MWKRRRAEVEPEEDDVVIDLRDRLEPYTDVDPAAIEALRLQPAGPADEETPESPWAIPSDWLRGP
jgi:hypothetical protein